MAEKIEYNELLLKGLLTMLDGISDKESKHICVGTSYYSITDLVQEIKNKTEVGANHYRMYVQLQYERLRFDNTKKSLEEKAIIESEAKKLGVERIPGLYK